MDNQEDKEKEIQLDIEQDSKNDDFKEKNVLQKSQKVMNFASKSMDSVMKMQESVEQIQKTFQPILRTQANTRELLLSNVSTTMDAFRKRLEFSIPEMSIANQIQELSDTLKRAFSVNLNFNSFYENVHRMSEIISESIQKIKIPSISEERKQELIEFYTLWGSYGWTINPCVSTEIIFKSMPSDKKSVDIIALKQCSRQEMEKLFKLIIEVKRVKEIDFLEAVFDYQHKKYKSCALVLFSLIDAILIRLQKRSSLNGKRRKVGAGAVNEVKKRIEMDVNTELLSIMMFYINLFACLDKVFEDGKDFKKQPDIINRNFLDHGMMTKRVRKKDCIQLFLLYYNMLELLDLIY